MQLPPIPGMSERLQMTIQPGQAAREAAALAYQTGQVMAQFGITTFHRVSLALVGQRQMVPSAIGQAIIQRKVIAKVLRIG